MIDPDLLLRPLLQRPLGEPPPVDQLAKRARRLRRARLIRRVGAALVLASIASGALLTLRTNDAGRQVETPAHGTSSRFVPATRVEGALTVMPLTFFDGTQLDLVFPTSSHLAQRGFTPGASAGLSNRGATPGRLIDLRYGHVSDFTHHAQRTNTYRGANHTTVAYYQGIRLRPRNPTEIRLYPGGVLSAPRNALAFQFGPWALFVEDLLHRGPGAMTDVERAAWAQNLTAHTTSDGFLVLDPNAPQLTLVGSDQPVSTIGIGTPAQIEILFQRCGAQAPTSTRWQLVRANADRSVFCSPALGLSIRIAAPLTKATRIVNQLDVRNFQPGTIASLLLG